MNSSTVDAILLNAGTSDTGTLTTLNGTASHAAKRGDSRRSSPRPIADILPAVLARYHTLSEDELQARYFEQQRRRQCLGCGEAAELY